MKHGWWCNAQTYRTQCRYCHEPCFYFQCDCGSKVFFDALGEDWPRHYCAEYLEAVGVVPPGAGQTKDWQQLTWDQLVSRVNSQRRQLTESEALDRQFQWLLTQLDEAYRIEISRKQRELRVDHAIIAARPQGDGRLHVAGVVREGPLEVDLFRKLGLERSDLCRMMIRPLLQPAHVQVTIHTGHVEEAAAERKSFTFFVAKDVWKRLGAVKGDLVFLTLAPEAFALGQPFWRCVAAEWPT